MKRRLITVILFAVLAAAGSSTMLFKLMSSNTSGPSKAVTATVLVAARDLNAGALIGEADVREAQWPVAEGGSAWLAKRPDVVGRGLVTSIQKDEPFAESRLAAKGAGAGLASKIPPGMRAIAVHVDELTGLSRFIMTGMHVDVISTGTSGQGMVSRTILQNVEVFSTGQDIERDSKDKPVGVPVFNLLVTPQDAEILSQAVAQTKIELVLRNPLDKLNFQPAQTAAVHAPAGSLAKATHPRPKPVDNAPPAPPVMAPAPQTPPTVEVIHGAKRSVNTVSAAPAGASGDPEPKQ
jgi:pilus assembly protein CpaB